MNSPAKDNYCTCLRMQRGWVLEDADWNEPRGTRASDAKFEVVLKT